MFIHFFLGHIFNFLFVCWNFIDFFFYFFFFSLVLNSTETAKERVCKAILLVNDSGQFVIIALLDLPDYIDIVDHSILVSRLDHWVGITATTFELFCSYLSDKSFFVNN